MTHREAFAAAYERLAGVYGQAPEDEAVQLHYEAVRSIPMESFAAVATRLAKTLRWFPKPAEWLEAYEAEQDARRREMDRRLDSHVETFCCAVCHDTGWEEHQCQVGAFCSSCSVHPSRHLYDHRYVTRCACWKTNPELERKREARRTTVQVPKRAA